MCSIVGLKNYSSTQTAPAHDVNYSIPKEKAEEIFSGLGENWWQQVFDGQYHQFGKRVFDEGLHGKVKEQGFYDSAKKAHDYAKANLGEPLTISFYKQLHAIACAHFKGRENNTGMNAANVGKFRNAAKSISCRVSFRDFIKFYDTRYKQDPLREELIEDFMTLKDCSSLSVCEIKEKRYLETLKEKRRIEHIDYDMFDYFNSILETGLSKLTKHIEQEQQSIDSALPTIEIINTLIYFYYENKNNFDQIVDKLFTNYNCRVMEINSEILKGADEQEGKEKKIRLIADLFQKLEWLHAFPDGQGRTDLILQNKLLAEQGSNPPVLDEPYVSTFAPLDDWFAYLKTGIAEWQKRKAASKS